MVVSTPLLLRLGRAAPLTVAPAITPTPQTSRQEGPLLPAGPPKEIFHIMRACALQSGRVGVVLAVCLVKSCVDILSIVDICFLLVVQEFFLCA